MLCPKKNCTLCPRLADFRSQNQKKFPNFYNAPVNPFGDINAKLLILGMAPGLKGANQTGRPFTNDYAGDLLYPTLKKFGFAKGFYGKRADDGFELINACVTNAVRCVPPQNKVIAQEVNNCRQFLYDQIFSMPNLKVIIALGTVAHNALLSTLEYRKSAFKFSHGAVYFLNNHNLILIDSYHTSRYNVNTGVLTAEMFEQIVSIAKKYVDK